MPGLFHGWTYRRASGVSAVSVGLGTGISYPINLGLQYLMYLAEWDNPNLYPERNITPANDTGLNGSYVPVIPADNATGSGFQPNMDTAGFVSAGVAALATLLFLLLFARLCMPKHSNQYEMIGDEDDSKDSFSSNSNSR